MHYLALLVCGILAINIRVARPSESESDDNELGERLDKDYDDTWSTDLHFHDDDLNGNPVEIRDKRFLGKLLETQRTIYFHNDQRYWMDIECGPEKDGGQKGIRSMEPYGFSLLQQGIVFYASPPLWCTVKSNRKIIKFKAYGSGYPEAPTGKEVHWKITEDGLFLGNELRKLWLSI